MRRSLLSLSAVLLAAAACEPDEPERVVPPAGFGRYVYEDSGMRTVGEDSSAWSIRGTLDLRRDGRYARTLRFHLDGEPEVRSDSGAYIVTETRLRLEPEGEDSPGAAEFDLRGDTLHARQGRTSAFFRVPRAVYVRQRD